jgi:ribosomal protein S18 acetylase RimI-like enzyme
MPNCPKISLRKVKIGDFHLLWPWYQEHIEQNFPDQEPDVRNLSHDISHGHGDRFVVIYEGKDVGYLWVDVKRNTYTFLNEGLIRFLHVDKDYRSKGIGTEMLRLGEELAKEQGADYITLGTNWKNKTARSIYNKTGYQPVRAVYRKELK